MLVNEFLEQSARALPDKVALVCQGERLTYREIDRAGNALGNALLALGLNRHDRVAVCLDNSAQTVISLFAILKASGIFVVVNPQVKPRKLEFILNDCQVRVLVTDSAHVREFPDIFARCPNLRRVILTDSGPSDLRDDGPSGVRGPIDDFDGILRASPCQQPPVRNIDMDLSCLIYTSGSTGRPKGVMLTHLNMVSAANSIIGYLGNTSSDIVLCCLPLSFDYGLYQVLMAFKFGGTVVLEKSFTYPYQVIEAITRERVTGFPLVPTMAAILLQMKNLGKFDFSSLRYVTNTAQALPPKHIEGLRRAFPHARIFSMYGLTECKRVSYLDPELLDVKPTSVGRAMPNVEVYLVGEDGQVIDSPHTPGELVIRGSNVMKGYWNQPELTDLRLRPDPATGERHLYSGDLFRMDEDGDLYFISRKDDVIKTAGELVSPKEIEDVLHELPGVAEAAVVGVPDDLLGYAVKACLVLESGATVSDADVLVHCRKHLEMYMVPKIIEFRPSLPRTPSGKIHKKALLETQDE